MTRNSQVIVGRKINKLIETEIGPLFSHKFQGAGKVANLVLAVGSKKTVSRLKTFLREELKLKLHIGSKNHGVGEKYTIQIALYEIEPDSIALIEEKFKLIAKTSKKKIVPEQVNEETPVVIVSDEIVLPSVDETKTNTLPVTHFMKKINPFLNGVFRFEAIFSSDKENLYKIVKDTTDENYLTILCRDEKIAQEVELAIGWYSCNSSLVARDGLEVVVNYSVFNQTEENMHGHFCLPPREFASIEEISLRLSRIRIGSKPSVSVAGENLFRVGYTKAGIASKVFADISKMGWPVSLTENTFMIDCGKHWSQYMKPIFSSKEVKKLVLNSTPYLTEAEDEALKKLRALVADEKTFMLLSEATKKEVLDLLKEIESKKKAEEAEKYAKSLLSIFENYRK